MKLSFRDIESFVHAPAREARVILVYGPDNGLMKERAATMGKTVTPDLNDPFNAVTLSTDSLSADPARLFDEASAISMLGGDRLIRVEDASDKLTTLIKDYLQNPSQSTLIILEAGNLDTRSTLRKLCESAKNAAAVPCYVEDERDLARLIRGFMQDNKLTIEGDAVNWLAANISGDRVKARSELEKLVTYKGRESGPVTLEDVCAACGAAGALAVDDLIYATAGNDPVRALSAYTKLTEEGTNFIVILRALQSHFLRLQLVKAHMDEGKPLDQAMKTLSPPVFFKQEPAFKTQVQRWSNAAIGKILEKLFDLEAQCKQTGTPVETLCAQTVLGISKMRG